jgi:hypothetical protein
MPLPRGRPARAACPRPAASSSRTSSGGAGGTGSAGPPGGERTGGIRTSPAASRISAPTRPLLPGLPRCGRSGKRGFGHAQYGRENCRSVAGGFVAPVSQLTASLLSIHSLIIVAELQTTRAHGVSPPRSRPTPSPGARGSSSPWGTRLSRSPVGEIPRRSSDRKARAQSPHPAAAGSTRRAARRLKRELLSVAGRWVARKSRAGTDRRTTPPVCE